MTRVHIMYLTTAMISYYQLLHPSILVEHMLVRNWSIIKLTPSLDQLVYYALRQEEIDDHKSHSFYQVIFKMVKLYIQA